jgi:hypothetical protein
VTPQAESVSDQGTHHGSCRGILARLPRFFSFFHFITSPFTVRISSRSPGFIIK